jgi:sodium/potassium-transporting ATPase subunit alpha
MPAKPHLSVPEQGSSIESIAIDFSQIEWHTIAVEELLRRWSVTIEQGLSADQVVRRTEQHGKNAPPPPQTQYVRKIAGYFFKGFGSILLLASVLVFIAWQPLGNPPAVANLALAIVLLAVFFIQAGFNMWQDWSSSRIMNSIKTMLPEESHVVRDGAQREIPSAEVVPGDVVMIKAGNKVPADVRFVTVSSDARFDRSILTGSHTYAGSILMTHC